MTLAIVVAAAFFSPHDPMWWAYPLAFFADLAIIQTWSGK